MLRVIVVDDNAVVRRGVASLLGAADDIDVVGEAANGKDAIAKVDELRPDLVLLDVRMPVMDGVSAARDLNSKTKVLMLTYAEDEDLIAGAIRAGASGYLVHGRFEPEELEQAVRDCAAGRSVLSPAVVTTVFDAVRKTPGDPKERTKLDLSEREREVMNLVAKGLANPAIAEQLFLSEKTVKNHINRIYAKLGVTTRAEAIASWLGITRPEG